MPTDLPEDGLTFEKHTTELVEQYLKTLPNSKLADLLTELNGVNNLGQWFTLICYMIHTELKKVCN